MSVNLKGKNKLNAGKSSENEEKMLIQLDN